ncbi:MAG: aldo/keto reductase family protein [Gemmatimonadota bacterium]
MEYRQLGRSGVRVSTIGLGSWLTYGRSVDERTAHACLSRAYELGVNFFDTADVYARGEAERTLGRWLGGIPRTGVVVATKVYFPMGDGPNDRGLSRKHIVESCHASLQRLGLDYVDLYQCHRYDDSVPLEETLGALDDLVTRGDVLYVGVSEWTAEQMRAALRLQEERGLRRLVSNQPQYSLVARRIEQEVLPLCRREGVGQVIWSPLGGGVLTGKYPPGEAAPAGSRGADPDASPFMLRVLEGDLLQAVRRLEREVAEPRNLTVGQLSLAWALHQEGITSAIVGATRPEQVEENVAAAQVELGEDALARVDEIMGPFALRAQAPSS